MFFGEGNKVAYPVHQVILHPWVAVELEGRNVTDRNNVPILFRVVKVIGEDVGMVDVEVGFPLEAVEVVFRLRPEWSVCGR